MLLNARPPLPAAALPPPHRPVTSPSKSPLSRGTAPRHPHPTAPSIEANFFLQPCDGQASFAYVTDSGHPPAPVCSIPTRRLATPQAWDRSARAARSKPWDRARDPTPPPRASPPGFFERKVTRTTRFHTGGSGATAASSAPNPPAPAPAMSTKRANPPIR